MFVELHIIQNFVPSNLNRDDTGSPKECEFGGYRRARISSQCLKRAVREEFGRRFKELGETQGLRTRRIALVLAERLQSKDPQRSRDEAERVAMTAISSVIKPDQRDATRTSYALYLAPKEIDELARLCDDKWPDLLKATESSDVPPADSAEPDRGARGAKRRESRPKAPPEVEKGVKEILKRGRNASQAVDIALFGRMIADLPQGNIDGSCQVAHALSVNKLKIEDDFFTAVEEFKADSDDLGAAMMDIAPLTSACFYRYANVSTVELMRNLDHNEKLARLALKSFLHASNWAVPSGKQHSTAPHNPPGLILAVVRTDTPWSLANAFVEPVRPTRERNLVDGAISALDAYWGELTDMYPRVTPTALAVMTGRRERLRRLESAWVPNFDELIERVMSAVTFESVAERK